MRELEYIRGEIRMSGYLSSLQVITRLAKYSPGIKAGLINQVLEQVECGDIHSVEYTNSYVGSLKFKKLFFYNPEKPIKRKKKKQNKRIVNKNVSNNKGKA